MKKIFLLNFALCSILLMSCVDGTGTNSIISTDYKVILDITSGSILGNDGSCYANGYVYDLSNEKVSGAIFKVDGVTLSSTDYDTYFETISVNAWEEGSTHSYYIKTPDGAFTAGSIQVPTDYPTNISYNPSTGLASSYTLFKTDAWEEGTVLYARIQKEIEGTTKYYGIPLQAQIQ